MRTIERNRSSGKCHDTGRVVIGIAYTPPPNRQISRDAEQIQRAFLTLGHRPVKPLHPLDRMLSRLVGRVWRWL